MAKIMVVPTHCLPIYEKVSFSSNFMKLIEDNYQYMERSEVEDSCLYRQIIPYVVFKCKNKVSVFRRLKGGEPRLTDCTTIGVGGHIDWASHHNSSDAIYASMLREIKEETTYNLHPTSNPHLRGFLNTTDGDFISQTHTGLIYVVELLTSIPDIANGSKMEHLGYYDLTRAKPEGLELWSSLVWDYLERNIGWEPLI